MEKHLEALLAQQHKETRVSTSTASSGSSSTPASPVGRPKRFRDVSGGAEQKENQYGIQYQNRHGDESVVWGVGGETTTNPPSPTTATGLSSPFGTRGALPYGSPPIQTQNPLPDPEEKALSLAIAEMYDESGKLHRPWAANGRALRIGEIILLVDSDTVVPEDCLRDAAREMMGSGQSSSSCGGGGTRKGGMGEKGQDEEDAGEEEWEGDRVGIIQHESDVMQVAGHYFENGIAYFTRRINRCISICACFTLFLFSKSKSLSTLACANGEVAPFMGHNAFLRWKALQDAAFVDSEDGKMKIWSENNVSEDFDMALRLMLKGYIVRWVCSKIYFSAFGTLLDAWKFVDSISIFCDFDA